MQSTHNPVALYRELTPLRHIRRFQLFTTVRPISVAEHSYYVALLAGTFAHELQQRGVTVDRAKVVQLALWHDAPEAVMGDLPHPIKRAFPTVAGHWEAAEAEILGKLVRDAGMSMDDLLGTDLEMLLVKIADWVELILYDAEERAAGNTAVTHAAVRLWMLLVGKVCLKVENLMVPGLARWYQEMLDAVAVACPYLMMGPEAQREAATYAKGTR